MASLAQWWKKFANTRWVQRWKKFFQLAVDPGTIILLAIAMSLGIILVKQTNPVAITTLTIMLSIVSGFLGAVLTNHWSSLNEEKTIFARGKVAVRGLMLLLGNISAVNHRVREYLERHRDDSKRRGTAHEVIKTYLEEIIGQCVLLEEAAISSIENWTDIIPEANVRTNIGVITELRNEVGQLSGALHHARTELNEVRGTSEEREEQLRADIEEKKSELIKLKTELYKKESAIGPLISGSGFSSAVGISGHEGLSEPFSYPTLESTFHRKCNACGHEFYDKSGSFSSRCPKCGSQDIGLIIP